MKKIDQTKYKKKKRCSVKKNQNKNDIWVKTLKKLLKKINITKKKRRNKLFG